MPPVAKGKLLQESADSPEAARSTGPPGGGTAAPAAEQRATAAAARQGAPAADAPAPADAAVCRAAAGQVQRATKRQALSDPLEDAVASPALTHAAQQREALSEERLRQEQEQIRQEREEIRLEREEIRREREDIRLDREDNVRTREVRRASRNVASLPTMSSTLFCDMPKHVSTLQVTDEGLARLAWSIRHYPIPKDSNQLMWQVDRLLDEAKRRGMPGGNHY